METMAPHPRIATIIKASAVPCGLFLIILLLNSPTCTEAENILYPRDTLYSGNSLTYGYDYALRMQRDCNLVLYEGETPIWASNTSGAAPDCYCNATYNGQLVIYDSDGLPMRQVGGFGTFSTYLLILQKDRNVALYGPAFWATNTNTNVRPPAAFKRLGRARLPGRTLAAANDTVMIEDTNTLYSGETLRTSESLAYGHQYVLVMQTDCNLVLYDTGNVLWESATGGQASGCSCTLLTDGTLVVQSPTGDRIWNSCGSTGEEGNYVLVLQRDRNLVIYGPSVWSTGTNKTQTAAG